jgi:hypothetical protein
MSRGNVVGRAAGYGLDDGGVGDRVPVASRIFNYPENDFQHCFRQCMASQGEYFEGGSSR